MGRKRNRPRRRFTEEFKREAVRLWREGDRPCGEVAAELGISKSALSRWAREFGGQPPEVVDLAETPEKELIRLRRRVRQLEEEREILKKATAFFAKESE